MKESRNPVVFRVHTGTGKVIALFPEEEVQPGQCLSFNLQAKPEVHQEIIHYRSAIDRSRPATTAKPYTARALHSRARDRSTGRRGVGRSSPSRSTQRGPLVSRPDPLSFSSSSVVRFSPFLD